MQSFLPDNDNKVLHDKNWISFTVVVFGPAMLPINHGELTVFIGSST